MTITMHIPEEDRSILVTGNSYLEVCIELLREINSTYEPGREHCKEILEALAELTEEDKASHFDMSSPESAFSLTFSVD